MSTKLFACLYKMGRLLHNGNSVSFTYRTNVSNFRLHFIMNIYGSNNFSDICVIAKNSIMWNSLKIRLSTPLQLNFHAGFVHNTRKKTHSLVCQPLWTRQKLDPGIWIIFICNKILSVIQFCARGIFMAVRGRAEIVILSFSHSLSLSHSISLTSPETDFFIVLRLNVKSFKRICVYVILEEVKFLNLLTSKYVTLHFVERDMYSEKNLWYNNRKCGRWFNLIKMLIKYFNKYMQFTLMGHLWIIYTLW